MLFLSLLVPFMILLEGAIRAKAIPQVYFDLTVEEFAQKVSEMAQLAGNASSAPNNYDDDDDRPRHLHDANIQKRAPVGGEINNSPVTQVIVEALAARCEAAFGAGYRPLSGKVNSDTQIEIGCSLDGSIARDTNYDCPPSEAAATIIGHNFRNGIATFGYCGTRIKVNTRDDYGSVTTYFGSWYPEPPNSPGTYDDYVALAGDGKGSFVFGSTSFKNSGSGHSWSCLACPGGLLKITTRVVTFAAGVSHKH
ncbi:hypothetical protein CTRI78_v011116 [Colletotrichum trifolii]|uniref:Secreted in xylem 1 protein n=1 Tax=Colletotrichum trifolii TaxID=5466 RepID=A0A4R8QHI7_COLTR|nr:hypothetical protein CTRI78_v011116 [Colletotrichum trifolii]